ncbi:ATP-binding cassette domain-containing protein [Actinomadura namibiensis]|uniref:ATP-binding cassette subfamily C protein n=1 Tax=Actinomadura namibiensis TaxID=182080 RepID=A0A7W3QRN2_ACTNM|nr:ABC transporter ATP-binding protein [Actinomadura namibiensis]MBA8956876.1 ATP-binding cassette subfamily C protein [Actinomadura namibiensis]
MSGPVASLVVRTLLGEPRLLVRLVAWSAVEAAPAFAVAVAIARAIEDGFAAGRPGTGAAWLALLGAVWLAAAVGARQVILTVAELVEPFRDLLLTRVVTGALHRSTGGGRPPDAAAVARAGLQVELARDALAAVVTVVRSFVFTVVSVVLGLLALAPPTLLAVAPPFLAGLALFLLSLPALARRQRAYLLADERTAAATGELAAGLRDIVACGAEDRVGAAVARRVAAQAGEGRALARVTALRTAALSLGGWLPVVLLLAAAPWLLRNGAGPGVVVGALACVTQSLIPAFRGFVEGLGVSAVRLAVALDRVLETAPPPGPTPPRLPAPSDTTVRLRGVTAAYGPHAAPVIDRLDLTIPAGDHLAVVGPSGIGKSTLAALVTGMLTPRSGEVTVGGVPADRLPRAARVLIPQEAYVFEGTVRENLCYLADAPPDRVREAVAAVGADALVERLGGPHARLDPRTLSAGERQQIALARAWLAPAGLTVLDEATCHLDPAAEARAEAAFARRGGTLVVVAHRISSALRARRVLLMDGDRVWLGTHEELVRTAPPYAELVGRWRPPDRDPRPEAVP